MWVAGGTIEIPMGNWEVGLWHFGGSGTDVFEQAEDGFYHMAVCQNLVPLVNIKIAGKWMFIPPKMVLIGIDPYPYFTLGSGGVLSTIPPRKGVCHSLCHLIHCFFWPKYQT